MLAILHSKVVRAAMGALVLASVTGCPDTGKVFDDFGTRYTVANPGGGTGGASACAMPPMMAGDGDGDYMFALSAKLLPKSPLLFSTTMTTTDGPSGLQFTWNLQPIDRCDRVTPVGSPIVLGPVDLAADGSFTVAPDPIAVDGAANPISGNDLVADVDLSGRICLGELSCGDVTGVTIEPPGIDLAGSTWTLEAFPMPGVFPDPVKINCAGDPQDPNVPPACP